MSESKRLFEQILCSIIHKFIVLLNSFCEQFKDHINLNYLLLESIVNKIVINIGDKNRILKRLKEFSMNT